MTFPQVSPKNKDAVVAVLQPLHYIERINAAGTHGADDADARGVLEA